MRKIGFLGAMNRDVVVEQPTADLLPLLGAEATPLVETPVSDAVAQRGSALLEGRGAATWLGGSAFNVARVVALLNRDRAFDLAFFGIAGSVAGTQPHLATLVEWAVDTGSVAVSPLPPATCLAMVEPSGRTLLTALGANAGIAAWLTANRDQLAKAIAGRDLVHVTSFLDPEAPGLIAGILATARSFNPSLMVSLDPGMAWIAPGGQGLSPLLRQTNILHLNAEEFALLGGSESVPGLLDRLTPGAKIVARTHAGATVFSASGAESLPERAPAQDFLAVDPNGAGDTFCGGFLSAYAENPDEPLRAAGLGFALARKKVGIKGPLTASEADIVMSRLENW
ncbi:carbohydrate kinase family protein [Devosia sediminis]|uniref:Carbohydrate kinase family protein n=1 Tax=Devosia sediminis TaxID=2798801 RepID=A0A934IWE2_9HYPH|nr:carbohydrate kinase family protein [Devosia sediminis]MBJ3785587.1 carbohydrate kinase family protein [Devosia sediminis]